MYDEMIYAKWLRFAILPSLLVIFLLYLPLCEKLAESLLDKPGYQIAKSLAASTAETNALLIVSTLLACGLYLMVSSIAWTSIIFSWISVIGLISGVAQLIAGVAVATT